MKRAPTEAMEPAVEVMPVFAVADETTEVVVSAGAKTRAKTVKQPTRASRPQRIGTAYTLSDGSIGVQLTSVPRNGKLVVRMPRGSRGRRAAPAR